MKTKIIYISGSEIFDMADIRAAFDTVRTALSLGKDTVLFGVPVDTDDAFTPENIPVTTNVKITENIPEPVIDEPVHPIKSDNISDVSASDDDNSIKTETKKTTVNSRKSPRQSRSKVVPIKPVVSEQMDDTETEQIADEKPAIPILSVLGAKTDSESVDVLPTNVPEPERMETQDIDISPINVTPVDVPDVKNEPIETPETQQVSIGDMLSNDDMPVAEHEKTLEELLESMTPLGEDEKMPPQSIEPIDDVSDVKPLENPDDNTDVTLELLAAEFAENADKIVPTTKPQARGKIGKLKNILPFKKAKRDDSGIMGDLFGWAGVANDEDFTIPGFFANATKK